MQRPSPYGCVLSALQRGAAAGAVHTGFGVDFG